MIPFRRPNIPIALLSILMSIGLWVHVQVQANSLTGKQPVNIKVRPINLDDGLTAEYPAKIVGTIVGSPDDARDIEASDDVYAEVDLRNAVLGAHRYRVQLRQGSVKTVISLENHDTVSIMVEKRVQRSVPVHVVTSGQLPNETLRYVDSVARPSEVIVSGAKSKVDSVTEVRALLDLSKVQPNTEYSIKAEALRGNNRPVDNVSIEPSEVSIRPALVPSPQAKPVLIQPVFEGAVAYGFRVAPENGVEVTPNQTVVQGSSLDIARITTINTNPINITGLSATTQFTATLDLPIGLSVLKGKPETVTVIVRIEQVPQQGPPMDRPRQPATSSGNTGP